MIQWKTEGEPVAGVTYLTYANTAIGPVICLCTRLGKGWSHDGRHVPNSYVTHWTEINIPEEEIDE